MFGTETVSAVRLSPVWLLPGNCQRRISQWVPARTNYHSFVSTYTAAISSRAKLNPRTMFDSTWYARAARSKPQAHRKKWWSALQPDSSSDLATAADSARGSGFRPYLECIDCLVLVAAEAHREGQFTALHTGNFGDDWIPAVGEFMWRRYMSNIAYFTQYHQAMARWRRDLAIINAEMH